MDYRIRIRRDRAPVQSWRAVIPAHLGSRRTEQGYSTPVKEQMAAIFPVFLVATGYSAGGMTYSLLMPNEEDPPVL